MYMKIMIICVVRFAELKIILNQIKSNQGSQYNQMFFNCHKYGFKYLVQIPQIANRDKSSKIKY